jgi:hypothetical protein
MMGLLSPILRNGTDGRLIWWCPGCDSSHAIKTGEGPGPRWGWNGNAERPTFTPSVLVTGRDFTAAGEAAFEAWHDAGCPKPAPDFESKDTCCHSFVVDGQMQMLGDCTHALAGQTVPIPPWPKQPDY